MSYPHTRQCLNQYMTHLHGTWNEIIHDKWRHTFYGISHSIHIISVFNIYSCHTHTSYYYTCAISTHHKACCIQYMSYIYMAPRPASLNTLQLHFAGMPYSWPLIPILGRTWPIQHASPTSYITCLINYITSLRNIVYFVHACMPWMYTLPISHKEFRI